MVLPTTIILGILGYLFYKTKEEVTLADDIKSENNEDEDLYKDLEDLFI